MDSHCFTSFEAQEFDNTCIWKISEMIHCVQKLILAREEKGGSTASQKATYVASVGHCHSENI